MYALPMMPSSAKFIILNAQFLVFDTQILIFNTQLLVFNTKFIICTHDLADQELPVALSNGKEVASCKVSAQAR